VTPFNTKEAALKDQYDEWLARIICFAFSVSPQALVAQMNRATAEVAQEAAQGAGLEPIKNWLKGTMDRILCEVYGEPGLEFVWLQKDAVDPEAQSRIHAAYVQCGVMGVDEVRDAIGLEARGQGWPAPIAGAVGGTGTAGGPGGMVAYPGPGAEALGGSQAAGNAIAPSGAAGAGAVQDTALNGAQVASLVQIIEGVNRGTLPKESAVNLIMAAFPMLAEGMVRGIIAPLGAGAGAAPARPMGGATEAAAPMAKAGPMQPMAPIDRQRASLAAPARELEAAVGAMLGAMGDAARDYIHTARAAGLYAGAGKYAMAKAADPWDIIAGLGFDFDPWLDDIEEALTRIAQEGGAAGLDQIREKLAQAQGAAFDQLVRQVNQKAEAWAKARAGELITQIDGATRRGVAGLVGEGIAEGWSVDELAGRLAADPLFDPARAQLIAHTELATADVAGNKLAYAESGVVTGLQWQAPNGGGDGRTCGACGMNHGAIVPLGPDGMAARPYPSGAMRAPAHPRCLCDEFPYLGEVE
jgi:hypothetical protein